MAATYKLINSISVGSGGVSEMEFTSIPGTYSDLKLVISARFNTAVDYDNFVITYNGTTTGYYDFLLYGAGGGASVGSGNNAAGFNRNYAPGTSATASIFSSANVYITNYANARNKTYIIEIVTENNASSQKIFAWATGMFTSSTAITSIKVTQPSTTIVQYSTAYLYGISNT